MSLGKSDRIVAWTENPLTKHKTQNQTSSICTLLSHLLFQNQSRMMSPQSRWGEMTTSYDHRDVCPVSPPRRKRLEVRFAETRVLYPTHALSDMTEEDIRETWFTPFEFDQIKVVLRETIQRMEESEEDEEEDDDQGDFCTRGLGK